ncbi:hypothetical protein X474_26160 [Dethiosulfatarculus sandiegensis]|uniref:Uncharacterized protein n=1 Tax=Dethiosulfatarculus sandiegensis TaxID=1429043 RepID=A0A0D2G8K9_9BACT|nr:hypothetical protein X474_26160 [Dethiosulfatarculus sandiegensis]
MPIHYRQAVSVIIFFITVMANLTSLIKIIKSAYFQWTMGKTGHRRQAR